MPESTQSILEKHQWRALGVFILYRLIIAAMLAGVFQFNLGPEYLGEDYPQLYSITSYLYLGFAILCPIGIRLEYPSHTIQVSIQVSVDIIAITLIMFASGGISSGLGTLLFISVTSAGVLLANTSALAFAAAATLSLFAEQSLALVYANRSSSAFTLAGIHGAVFFSTTLLAIMLGARVKQSEELALQSREQINRLRKLNAQVIQYMRSGLLVIDKVQNIILKNEAASQMLKIPLGEKNLNLHHLNEALSLQFNNWLTYQEEPEELSSNEQLQLLPYFSAIHDEKESLYLIFLEDTTYLKEHAQNLKLASLGRLTGSIAHEIRNPLGAASHAAQLLSESPELDPADHKLVDIIGRHCRRMNAIIESIMDLSQRKQAAPQAIHLATFFDNFIQDFVLNREPQPQIHVEIAKDIKEISFDPNHLVQILTNLCDNGLRYSLEHNGTATIELKVDIDPETQRKYLDIIDQGKGIAAEATNQLFEPFYTTSHGGTGLGLYLSRELCIANRAKLLHIPQTTGTCFRILFFG